MSETSLTLFWVEAGGAFWLAFILQLVYRRIYREPFLHYWSLSFAVMGVSLAAQLAVVPASAPELFSSPLLYLLGIPQFPLIILAALSLRKPAPSRRREIFVFTGIIAAMIVLYLVTAQTITDPLMNAQAQRFERLVLNVTASLWFCVAFWRKHYLARSVGGQVTVLFTGLRALHSAAQAATIVGIPLYPGTHSQVGGAVASILPFGIAAGMILLAAEAMTITNRKLQESEARYRLLAENTSDTIWLYDIQQERFTYVSPTVVRQRGFTPEEVMSQFKLTDAVTPEDVGMLRQQLAARVLAVEQGDESARFRTQNLNLRRKDGSLQPSEVSSKLITDSSGRVTLIQGVTRDISERRRLEAQLLQAQKMESVGRLAGGVAHDFNNILQVIKGFSELVIAEIPPRNAAHHEMEQVLGAVERAQNLVRQLLIFSRREIPQKKHFALSALVAGMTQMLSRVIGEHMRLATQLEDEGRFIYADSGQVEQALLNLCINAKDAMPNGGTIRISTKRISVDEASGPLPSGAREGEYVVLTVSDEGTGMAPETIEHLFEPFFTTKEVGRGTGLGLATVYGIVKQHDGFTRVESSLGEGTAFHLYFPETPEVAVQEFFREEPRPATGGNETILLVEDDGMVRAIASRFLGEAGYRVIEAPDGAKAVEFFIGNPDEIQLVILDLIMPNLGGGMAGERIREIDRSVPILYVTGYDFNQLGSSQLPDTNFELIHKPFSQEELLRKVRQMLDQAPAD
jgi:PAS domain S-box-containing protein